MKKTNSNISKWGVVVFPGSNCDHDGLDAIGRICGQNAIEIWHKEDHIQDLDGILLPGGFSYGDYLRAGAIARFSSVVAHLPEYVENGKLVIGICNGFQVLTESGLLPGVLMQNEKIRFICKEIFIRVERADTAFTTEYKEGQVLCIPIAHNEGNFYLPVDELSVLEDNNQVIFRYCDKDGNVTDEANPNGSVNNIAGIINEQGNVLGMMPHPERRCDPILGKPDGEPLFGSMINHITTR